MKDLIDADEDDKLSIQIPRLQTTTKTFRYKNIKTWNMMPETLRSEMRIATLKKQLKNWLKDRRKD